MSAVFSDFEAERILVGGRKRLKEHLDLWNYAMEVIGVSSTGVLAPGPLFMSNLMLALNSRINGLRVAAGHSLVEVPLVTALFFGLLSIQQVEKSSWVIALIGGAAILGFAALQFLNLLRSHKLPENGTTQTRRESGPVVAKNRVLRLVRSQNPVAIGAVLTGFNPFFLLWWLTVGLKLIFDSQEIGNVTGITLLLSLHTWMDFAWLGLTGFFASKISGQLTRRTRIRSLVIVTTAILMCGYGISFLLSSVSPR